MSSNDDRLLEATFMSEVRRLISELNDSSMWQLREMLRSMLDKQENSWRRKAMGLICDSISYTSIVELRSPAKREAILYAIERSLMLGIADSTIFDSIVKTLTSVDIQTFPLRDNAEEG